MSMKKTLGGDRLGSGNKMQVELHGFERSTQDLGYTWRSTMAAGTLVPFINELALPGDTFDINLNAFANTHPTIGPLFGSYKVQLDVFQAPIRLYQGVLHNNKIGIGMKMKDVKLPQMAIAGSPMNLEDPDNSQINPSCLLSYLGVRGATNDPNYIRTFNAIPLLVYWDIYKQYYSAKMEEIGAVIHRPKATIQQLISSIFASNDGITQTEIPKAPAPPSTFTTTLGAYISITFSSDASTFDLNTVKLNTSVGWIPISNMFKKIQKATPTQWYLTEYDIARYGNVIIRHYDYVAETEVPQDGEPQVHTFPLENLDTMREHIQQNLSIGTPFRVDQENYPPYNWLLKPEGTYHSKLSSQEGLALKTYQSDLFNNWVNTEWIDGAGGVNEVTAIDTTSGSINVDTIILARKVYDMLNRIAVSGGTYDDWQDAVWAEERYRKCTTPMYMGGLIKEITFQEVISQAEAGDLTEGKQPLGTLAGKGVMTNKHKGGQVSMKIDEPSWILAIVSITPRLDYSQGNKWLMNLENMDDLHKPSLDQIGFQELITDQMAWWDTGNDGTNIVTKSAGKQPAWVNYMTNVNEVRGNFAIENNEMFMTLNRKYEYDSAGKKIKDLTTYIDPVKFNHIFAQTSRDAQNFWMQIGVDMIARRKMSAKLMPNL